jgi:4-hydroxybenzoate polyprenyltransferase
MHTITENAGPRPGLWRKFVLTLEMIKFEHSIFALPFALTGALLAWRSQGFPIEGLASRIAWIIVAMVAARSAAMAFNRVLDASIDARNPRTRMRHIPAGLLSRRFAWGFTAGSSALLVSAAAMLNPLCLALSPVALAIVLFYSWTKRFTAASHLVLGLSLGIAPAAAWIAMTGALAPPILWLTAAVLLWTAGFDIIYSCQDVDFDRAAGLHSLPARLGPARALVFARVFHALMVGCLALLAAELGLGMVAAVGIGIVAGLLLYEHRLVRADDLSRVDAAFFTLNGWVSVLFFGFWTVDVLIERYT